MFFSLFTGQVFAQVQKQQVIICPIGGRANILVRQGFRQRLRICENLFLIINDLCSFIPYIIVPYNINKILYVNSLLDYTSHIAYYHNHIYIPTLRCDRFCFPLFL